MKNEESSVTFNPIISSIQRIALYETKARFYLMGSNNRQTKFRVLKIDRMDPKELIVVDDNVEYTKEEIRTMVTMLDNGNRTRMGQRLTSSGVRLVSAFGIIGFVRFLEGYYIILITKRRRVAVIGHHTIYKIEDTNIISIPHDDVRISHPDEPRYLKMFQNIDLSSNFYFSYSYDITHTLQNNMSIPKYSLNKPLLKDCDCFNMVYNNNNENISPFWSFSHEKKQNKPIEMGVVSEPNDRFVWNRYLLRGIENVLHPDWILYITHGFVGQSNMSVFGRSIYVTLIARRSSKYAGTRFFKRGANFQGDVANEVETEQLVHDANVSCLRTGRFSSFVQIRGSVPGFWSQDPNKMVPKPPINFDLSDPFNEIAGKHFNQLLTRYGSPIIVLNLVKKREKKKHESMLSIEFSNAIKYLNQFLPPEHYIQYVSFDMARMNKGKEANVMGKLANIAHNAVCKTGIYQSRGPYPKQEKSFRFQLQTGLIRVNCVDCLDRTNTAQFAVGKCALGFQLSALGIIDSPNLEFDSDCVRMLEELYEDHGDTLALQYGGSQLVHRIKTYRKTAPWTSQGNDIMQTLSRYYSNTFSDAEKQHTINLFLGIFIPDKTKPPIWDMATDYYLHHQRNKAKRSLMTQWWDCQVFATLPFANDNINKFCRNLIYVGSRDEQIDGYLDYHRPFEFTVFSEMFAYKISHSVRDFMPHFTTNFSPFTVRVRPVRRRDESSSTNKDPIKNPSLTGRSSTSSTTSSTSSSDDFEESEDDLTMANSDSQPSSGKDSNSGYAPSFKSFFRPMNVVYGTKINEPSSGDASLYQSFAQKQNYQHKKKHLALEPRLPIITTQTIKTFKNYLKIKVCGADKPFVIDLVKYQKYSEIGSTFSEIPQSSEIMLL